MSEYSDEIILKSDTADQSQTRLVVTTTSNNNPLIPTYISIEDHHICLQGISKFEITLCAISYRRQLMDIINILSMRSIIESSLLGFPKTLRRMTNTDSNHSGSVVFMVESRELVGRIVPTLPKYMVIKMSPHMLSPKTLGHGRFTDSPNHLCRTDPPNVEALIMLKLRKLILKNILPNVCLLYKYCVMSNWRVVDEGLPIAALEGWRKWRSHSPPLCRDTAVVMIVEYCRGGSLRQLAKSRAISLKEWKSILWQMFYTLAVLDEEFPLFKHNDLHLGNVLIQNVTPGGHWEYKFKKYTYYVPNYGLSVRLFDFDWASAGDIPNAKMNRSLHRRDVPAAGGPTVFDVHYFLNIMYSYKNLPEPLSKWIQRLYGKSGVKNTSSMCLNRRLCKDIRDLATFPTPQRLMLNAFFDEYKTFPNNMMCGLFTFNTTP